MGLFDFMSNAGDDPAETATSTVEVADDRVDALRQQSITDKLAQLDIAGEQVNVAVSGEIATLTGSAPSQEALEKMVLCAGNQFGIGQVDCQLTVDAPAVIVEEEEEEEQIASTFYTVQSGDTLGKIAAAQYGDASKYPVIFEANKPMLTDPDKIYPGQSLRIPAL
jgi:nucleoid-associated protein YgaU